MKKQQEKLLIATLAGLVVCGAAAMVLQPASAASTAGRTASAPIDVSVLALERSAT